MSKVLVTEGHLEAIADAIRAKNGSYDTYSPGEMAAAIRAIPTSGIIPAGTVNISENGTVDVTQYASAAVNVQPALQAKTVTQNGTVTPDSGYDGLSSVVVNVQGGGGSAILLAENTYSISDSYTYDKTVTVSESGTYKIAVQAYTSNLTVKINDVSQTLAIEVSGDYTRLYSATISMSAGDVIDIYATSTGRSTVTAFIVKEE